MTSLKPLSRSLTSPPHAAPSPRRRAAARDRGRRRIVGLSAAALLISSAGGWPASADEPTPRRERTRATRTTRSAQPARCVIPRVDLPRITQALAVLARAHAQPAPSRLWALLPNRITAGGRQSVSNGAGLTTVNTASSVRWLAGDRRGWNVRLSWNLARLWRPRPRDARSPLRHVLLVDRVASRMAAAVQAVGVARAAAMAAPAVSGACARAKTRARAGVLRLRALLAAARAIPHS